MPMPTDFEIGPINPRLVQKPGGRQFGPDNPPPATGRPLGAVNKATKDLKEGLLAAAFESRPRWSRC